MTRAFADVWKSSGRDPAREVSQEGQEASVRVARFVVISLSIAGLLVSAGPALAQSPTAGGAIGTIDHPIDPKAVVLRYDIAQGFEEHRLTPTPSFTLYGDNSVIFHPRLPDGVFPGSGEPFALPALMRATLSPEQVDALLSFALGRGGLQGAQESYASDPDIADPAVTVFTINAAGIAKVVTIEALGKRKERAARARFLALAHLLDSFEEQVALGNVLTTEAYQPAAYRGALTEVPSDRQGTPIEWPYADLTEDDFVGIEGALARYAALTPEQVAAVTIEPTGGAEGIMVQTADGARHFLFIRPLLPDEPVLPEGVEAALPTTPPPSGPPASSSASAGPNDESPT